MQIRDSSGTLRTVTSISMRDAGGTLRSIQAVNARDAGGVLRVVFSGFKVTVSPDNASGSIYSYYSYFAITSSVIATITGGAAPLTYAWTAGGGWSATNPFSNTTAFRSPTLAPGDTSLDSAYLTVTDANGATAVSSTVTLYAYNGY